jgi:serine protease Do
VPFNPKYVAALVFASLLILVVGSQLRPRDSGAAPLSAAELARLTEASQRRALDGMTAYFTRLADRIADFVVATPDVGGSATVWGPASLVAARLTDRPPDRVNVAVSGSVSTAGLEAWSPAIQVLSLKMPGGGSTLAVPPPSTQPTEAGAWIIVVWRVNRDRMFATGTFAGESPVTCGEATARQVRSTIPLESAMAGGSLYDADGRLLAVVMPCGDGFAALTPPSISALLDATQSVDGRLLARFGMHIVPLTTEQAARAGSDNGFLVDEVWTGSVSDLAGLRPGDVIQKMNDADVTAVGELLAPEADASIALTVWRWRATVRLTLVPWDEMPAMPDGTDPGFRLEQPAGFAIADVAPGSAAAQAGLRTGDRLLRIDGATPRDAAEVGRLLAGGRRPVFVELQRRRRRIGVLLR